MEFLPKEKFEINGTEVIGWLSSNKGFEDITARLIYINNAWHWADSEEPVKRPDLINGCIIWPEPPNKTKQGK